MAVKWNGAAIRERVKKGAYEGVVRGTERVHALATEKLMNGPKTGKKWPGLPNQSSAPGEAPATQSGDLQKSGTTSYDADNLKGVASWSAAHALPLEKGATRKSDQTDDPMSREKGTQTLEPRPFAMPALMESIDGIRSDIADEIRKALA